MAVELGSCCEMASKRGNLGKAKVEAILEEPSEKGGRMAREKRREDGGRLNRGLAV